MDDVVKAYYHDYKKWIVSLLSIFGLWPDDSKQSKISRIIKCSLSLFITLITILGVMSYIIHSRNVSSLVAGLRSIGSFASVFLKGMMLMLLWQDVKKLDGGLSALFESDLKVPEYRVHLLSYYNRFYRLFQAHSCYCMGFIVLSIYIPVVEALRGNYVRALTIRVPFDYTPGDQLHWIILAFEMTSSTCMGTISFSVDVVFGLFAQNMVGELRLLSHRFRNLKPGKTYKHDLKDCIDRHCLLIQYKYMIDKVFGFISVTIALTCAIVICTSIFQITQNKNLSLFKIIFAANYVAIKWLQSYTYGWFGNAITVESERCLESMYFSLWTEFEDLRFRKDVLIIQSQSPIYINAMGIMIVRLNMFIKVAHASVSYYCLLKTIEKKFA